MRGVLWGIAASVGALVVINVWMVLTQTFDPKPCLPAGFQSAILAIELPRTGEEVARILGYPEAEHNRAVMRQQIFEDWFFIVTYWSFFAGIGLFTWMTRWVGARVLAVVIWAGITATAVYDYREDRAILAAVDCPPYDLDDAKALTTRHASLAKWGLLFATCLPTALPFLAWQGARVAVRVLTRTAALTLIAAGLIGLAGLADARAIPIGLAALTLSMVAVLALCLGFRTDLINGIANT